jgi:hypothetical protein
VDCLLGNEVQVQWDLALAVDRSLSLDRLLLPGSTKRVATGHNIHEHFHRSQYSGTCVATFDRLSQFVQSTGSDPHGLGPYSWVQVGAGTVSTRIVSLYIPNTTKVSVHDDKRKRMTVYNQQRRYFRSIGDFRCPRSILVDHIGTQIALWIAAGEQVLLFTDANSDVYRGILAHRLLQDNIRMSEKCRDILGHESPASHSSGSSPITGIFATSGIDCKNVLQSAHGAGVGDHRFCNRHQPTYHGRGGFPEIGQLRRQKTTVQKSTKPAKPTTSLFGRTSSATNLLRSMTTCACVTTPSQNVKSKLASTRLIPKKPN